MVVIASRDHRLAKKDYAVARDFEGEHLFMPSPAEDSLFAKTLARDGVKPRKHTAVMLTEAIVELVRAGVGVSALPRWVIARQLRAGDLVAVPFTKKGLIRRWGAATLKTSATQPPVETLIELLSRVRPG